MKLGNGNRKFFIFIRDYYLDWMGSLSFNIRGLMVECKKCIWFGYWSLVWCNNDRKFVDLWCGFILWYDDLCWKFYIEKKMI